MDADFEPKTPQKLLPKKLNSGNEASYGVVHTGLSDVTELPDPEAIVRSHYEPVDSDENVVFSPPKLRDTSDTIEDERTFLVNSQESTQVFVPYVNAVPEWLKVNPLHLSVLIGVVMSFLSLAAIVMNIVFLALGYNLVG